MPDTNIYDYLRFHFIKKNIYILHKSIKIRICCLFIVGNIQHFIKLLFILFSILAFLDPELVDEVFRYKIICGCFFFVCHQRLLQ